MTKAKAIKMPGKKRPAASRLVIHKPPTTEPHHRNHGRLFLRLKARLANAPCATVKQSRLRPSKVAGFEVTTSGRF
jgi:hypothetical protein